MTDADYWLKRAQDSIGRMESAVNGSVPELVKSFEAAKRELTNEIYKFYGRYAVNNKISLENAEKTLSFAELQEFRDNLKEFEKLAKESIGTFNLEVANLSIKARITRFQALQMQCDAILQKLYQEQKRQIEGTAESVYTDEYYHSLFNIEQYTGYRFFKPAVSAYTSAVQKVLAQPVQGADISTHLWRQDIDTGFKIRQTLNNMFVTGQPPQNFADDLQKTIGAVRVDSEGNVTGTGKKFEAYRLLYCESAQVMNQANLQAYEDDGLDEYEFVATLDSHTTEMCRSHDGKHYQRSEAVTGVNFPPLHVFCRSTTAPYIPDLKDIKSTRMARDEKGNSIRVENQTYDEWAKNNIQPSQNELKSGIINTKDKFGKIDPPARYSTSQEEINSIMSGELKNVHFSAPVTYNPRLRVSYGQTKTIIKNGRVVGQSIEIGKQREPGSAELIDTLVHEELEARIVRRAYDRRISKFIEMDKQGERGTHPYILPRVERFLRLKGLR